MENNNTMASFENLDLGFTKPTSIPVETIHVDISVNNLFNDYGSAFVEECYRVNPLKAKQVDLTAEEMWDYIYFLVHQRILSVENKCRDFRKLKTLNIPAWIQYNLRMIGRVELLHKGLIMVPSDQVWIEENHVELITFDQAFEISMKIASFISDGLQIVHDAMPRSEFGDKDVMTSALIAGVVRSIDTVEHPVSTYVTAFMGMKVREEAAFKALYRIEYDDYEFIRQALTRQRGLF